MRVRQQTIFWNRWVQFTCQECGLKSGWVYVGKALAEWYGGVNGFRVAWTEVHADYCPAKFHEMFRLLKEDE